MPNRLHSLFLAAFFILTVATTPAAAQDPSAISPEDAARLLSERPELGAQVQSRLLQSGLSDDEVRSRLRSQGFPADFLDAYLGDGDLPSDTGDDVLEALSLLGVPEIVLEGSDSLDLTSDSIQTEGIELFGLNVFRNRTSQFAPISMGPVSDDYRIGPGDVFVLILTGDVEQSHQIEVTRGGFVVIPQVGQIFVNNVSMRQFRQVLYDRLGAAYSGILDENGNTTTFDMIVARTRVNEIRVLGEVVSPGSYTVSAASSVLEALYRAGGPTSRGRFRSIELRRQNRIIETIDLYDFLLTGSISTEQLEPGDVIFVPTMGRRVTVVGEIVRPAIYELKDGEDLEDLIDFAGGLTPAASPDNISITRTLPVSRRTAAGNNTTFVTVDYRDILSGTRPAEVMENGDSVTVFGILGPIRNSVSLVGPVWQPGRYEFNPGMTLQDVVAAAGGLRPEVFANRGLISRMRPDSTTFIVPFTMQQVGSEFFPPPLVLADFDSITIYSAPSLRPARTVEVHGAVNTPGPIAFSDSLTLRDVIIMAGGFTDAAFLESIEISRVMESPTVRNDSLAEIIIVPIDSTYVTDTTGYVVRTTGRPQANDFYLHPWDNVFVRRQPGLYNQRNVYIGGEVVFPGSYTMNTRLEDIHSLIGRAGGIKPTAYPEAARFMRSQGNLGRITIDLGGILESPSHRDNLALEAGDSLFIPSYNPVVEVRGQVYSPTNVTFLEGEKARYYVRAAGDFTDDAEKGDTYVIQPNGIVSDKNSRPLPGSIVVVPTKPDRDGLDLGILISGIAQVLSAVTTIILVVQRI